ncbi:hypothetical protein O181_088666 [Austropuccinia psidii MF-1]|uniref:DUF4939 domain-containing protein n=1 Tax=Austropuccinia psidii MF-1 TaxID=1389203 RepID=A0A9Q3IRZ0_9BASI|nr:hypothetical protein [Austropuccinia psidii MF-1]
MPIQHSPPTIQTRSQARTQAVVTQTPRAALYGNPEVPQLRAHLDREPDIEVAAPSRKEGRGSRRSISFSGVAGTGGPTLAQSNQSEPSLLALRQQITHIMAKLKSSSSSVASRPQSFKTPSIKEPDCFYGTQTFKVRSFIQYCQIIFHNDKANLSEERKKVPYITSFLIGRASKWI